MGKKKKKIKFNASTAKEAICNYIRNISKEPGEGVFASHPFLPSEFEKMYVGICTDFNSKDFDTLKVREHLRLPQLDFRKIIGKEQPSGTKIAKYMEGKINVAETAIMDVYPYQAEAEAQPEFEEYDYEKLSAAARVCHNLGITEKGGKKCINTDPINVLNIHYGYGSGLKLIQQLINKGVLKRDGDYISVVDKPLEEFDWYIKKKEDDGKVE